MLGPDGFLYPIPPGFVELYIANGFTRFKEEKKPKRKVNAKAAFKVTIREFLAALTFEIIALISKTTESRHQPISRMLGLFLGAIAIQGTMQHTQLICLNPLVSFVACICGKAPKAIFLLHLILHFIASGLAFWVAYVLIYVPEGVDRYICWASPNVTRGIISGVALEFVAAFIMSFIIAGALDYSKLKIESEGVKDENENIEEEPLLPEEQLPPEEPLLHVVPIVAETAADLDEIEEAESVEEPSEDEIPIEDATERFRRLLSPLLIAASFVVVNMLGAAGSPVGMLTVRLFMAILKDEFMPIKTMWVFPAGSIPGAIIGALIYRFGFGTNFTSRRRPRELKPRNT